MPFNHVLRKCTGDNKISKSHGKFNHLIYINDKKLFAKVKTTRDSDLKRMYKQDIAMEFGIETI